MSYPADQGEGQVESDQLARIANAVAEVAKSVRAVKIVLILYASVTLLVSVGSMVWIMSGLLTRTIREQLESARPPSSREDARSDLPSEGDSVPAINRPGADGGSGSPVLRVGNGVTSPRLRYKVEPEYSKEARAAKHEGTVLLAAEVWEDGAAHNVRVVESLGLGLDEKAVEAVKKWRFSPGKKDGQPVRVTAHIQVSFRLL